MSPTVWVLGAASHEARRRQARPEVRRLFIVTGRPVTDDCAGRAEVTFIQSSSISFISAVQTLTPHTTHNTPHQNWLEDTVSIEDNCQCTDQLLNSQSTLSTVRFLILISPLIHCLLLSSPCRQDDNRVNTNIECDEQTERHKSQESFEQLALTHRYLKSGKSNTIKKLVYISLCQCACNINFSSIILDYEEIYLCIKFTCGPNGLFSSQTQYWDWLPRSMSTKNISENI